MPEPRALPRTVGVTPPLWPDALPSPQAESIGVAGPMRAELFDTLTGPRRARIRARTASAEHEFACFFTPEQMQAFEEFYLDCIKNHDGEFYARWIGGSRVVAFVEPYQYQALGKGYVLSGRLIRTRIDSSACDAYLEEHFGDIYRADWGASGHFYVADIAATETYGPDYDLRLFARFEC